ncbi:Xenobiotic-transporting ATPase [Stanieria cyanosphaera PCC 7437]|uniref:Xenobiotic-transporting ATPase n=1 Tax=Stanieria cyanosphaera (strain ATCC 29371 / PCC 7437) TaxID=111780 RepID=K9XPY4_STAC7|nr:ABC transporter ATP-binding protein [Stanieria cyanosphaera]AFZ34573.1 Xenobiotic-transporting ATPase [Stanieria cyanosphaera PCC 7437]
MNQSLKQKLKGVFRFLPALRLVWQASPVWTTTHVVLIIIQGIIPIILLYLTKLIIDTVTVSVTTTNKESLFQKLVFFIILTGVATLINVFCSAIGELVKTAQSRKVTDYMSSILHAKSIEVDLEYYENPQYFDTLQRAQQEAIYRPNIILGNLVWVAQNFISLVTMVGLLLSLHWGIGGILFVAAIPSVLVRIKFTEILFHWQRKQTAMERQGQYLSWLLTGDNFAKEIRLFNLGNIFSQQYDTLRKKLYQENLNISTKRSFANVAAQSLAALLMLAAYSYIIYQAFLGIIRIGDLVIYREALQRGQSALTGLLGSLSSLYEDNLFLSNLYEFLDLKPNIVQPANPKPVPKPIQKGIVFERVSFQYANSQRQAIKDINLTLGAGEVIALVGENGSGKTTLIKLLCRLYEPTSGNITVDGINLNQLDTTAWRREVSVIFQDYVKYHFTAAENIRLGNVEIPANDQSVVSAAMLSGAHDVITRLPQSYHTVLGKLFNQGEELSIGQWQKVALARAFLRKSQIIVLDEPTSAMDPKAEYEVFENFRQLIKGQAAILISHRLSTVKMADRIYVMDQGSIVESGTHEELIQLQGSYAYLFETQAQNYR